VRELAVRVLLVLLLRGGVKARAARVRFVCGFSACCSSLAGLFLFSGPDQKATA